MYKIIVQRATDASLMPSPTAMRKWAKAALKNNIDFAEVTIRIVDVEEMTMLNSTYRHKSGPTNVLSFPFDVPAEMQNEVRELGDIVICADVVNREAKEQTKSNEAHWAHMIVHGIFHLLGYDHVEDHEAEIMEGLETNVLAALGYPNPYSHGERATHD